jgi:hypothetical protein
MGSVQAVLGCAVQESQIVKAAIQSRISSNASVRDESLDKFVLRILGLKDHEFMTSAELSSSLRIGVREAQELLTAAFLANFLRLFTVPRIGGRVKFESAKEGSVPASAFRIRRGHVFVDPNQIDRIVAFKKDSFQFQGMESK